MTVCYGEPHDPTMPPNWTPSAITENTPKDIHLSGIFTSRDQKNAIINDKSVKEGDLIQAYEVISIRPNLVILKSNQGIFVVPLTVSVATPVKDNT